MAAAARNYALVTSAYWGFTLTDGALRMLVLLHFYQLGYSPFTLAFLFLLYEFAGILANLIGGWLATRYGISRMLIVGLSTQILGFLLLSALSPDWTAAASVAWVVFAQGICGVAKDLTKTSSKSAIKITASQASGQLFKWVAWFTGSKNAMKGVGFFMGGVLLEFLGFQAALWAMAAMLGIVLLGVIFLLPPLMGKSKASSSARELFAKNQGINLLALARIGLFGARDVWFVVGVPVFLYSAGWTFTMVGGFLAASGSVVVGVANGRAACIGRSRDAERAAFGMGSGCRFSGIWNFLCSEFFGSFVLNPGLRRLRKSRRRCWLLLRCQRFGPFHWNLALGPAVPVGRACRHLGGLCAYAFDVLAYNSVTTNAKSN